MCPEIILTEVDEQDYQQAGSKFVQMPPGAVELYLDIECGLMDWDTPGKSLMIPVTVTEAGVNEGKTDKLSFGVTKNDQGRSGLWKGKQAYTSITGHDMPMKDGHPAPDTEEILAKPAVGKWVMQRGHKGGDPSAEEVNYPKLMEILPAGSKPSQEVLF